MDDMRKCKCGGSYISIYESMCSECAEKRRFEKAKKIKPKDYKYDIVYDPKSKEYYSFDELEEYYEENETPLPEYVYGCKHIDFSLDMYTIIENELEYKHYEGAFQDINNEEINRLQKFVDEWTKAQNIGSWEQDCNVVIILK